MKEYQEALPAEIETIIDEHLARQPFGGIMRISDFPQLAELWHFVEYVGERWFVVRRKVDQLDQITANRLQSDRA